MSEKKRLCYIHTMGCQMNVHDSEQMAVLLKRHGGYDQTDDVEQADLVIVNTCSVREKAEQKAHSFIGRMRKLKRENPDMIVGVAGCLAQQWGELFIKRSPHLDFVCGTHNFHRIAEIVDRTQRTSRPVIETDFHKSVRSIGVYAPPQPGTVHAFVTIMQGCNNFCSYCIVPYLRGREESRDWRDIVNEVTTLADDGVKEVTLLGQNVNSYGQTLDDDVNFSRLIGYIHDIKGIERIRFTTSHPKDLSDGLIDCFHGLPKLCEHIHLPVQAGSNRILKRMNRGYTVEEYMRKVEKLHERCHGISVTSDIIVGFPGETEEDFQKTIDLMEKVRFDNTFSFQYSDRPGIASVGYAEKVPMEVKKRRLVVLQSRQKEITLEKNQAAEGAVVDVLVDGVSKNSARDVTGRTRTNRIVNFEGDISLIGQVIDVKITTAYMHSLRGVAVPGGRFHNVG